MDGGLPTGDLTLWRADALELFDRLHDVDLDAVSVRRLAHKQALMDLLTRREETDVPLATEDEVAVARADVSQEHGW
ncbi:hypothetical protein AB0J89_00345 [Micromonospora chokoriensis]